MRRSEDTFAARATRYGTKEPLLRADVAAVVEWCLRNGAVVHDYATFKFGDWLCYRAALDGVVVPDGVQVIQPESGGIIMLVPVPGGGFA